MTRRPALAPDRAPAGRLRAVGGCNLLLVAALLAGIALRAWQLDIQILIDDMPAPFVYHRANVYLVKPNVTGYTTTSADAEWPGERGSVMTLTK